MDGRESPPPLDKLRAPRKVDSVKRLRRVPCTVAEYFLHPPTGSDPKTLAPGETDTVIVPAKALAAGTTTVARQVFADPDLDWLFPKVEDSALGTNNLTVAE